jgi:D-amino-acid dehydrogenase
MSGAVEPRRITVIGAGMVGVSCALFLRRDGHDVTIMDPNDPGSGASYGNAGSISVSSVVPSSTPGLLKRVPKMLMDRESPLVLRWPYLPRLAPWLLGFVANSARHRVEGNARATARLFDHVLDSYDILIRETGCGELINPTGTLKVFETDESYAASAFERAMMDECGVRYDVLSIDELRQMEPNLAPIFRHALFIPDSRHIHSPGGLVERLAESFVSGGGRILREQVRDVRVDGDGVPTVVTDGGEHVTDRVIVAMGARSGTLARRLGARVVLDAERGYHIMFPEPERSINRYIQFADRKFSMSPQADGIRMTALVELASVDAPPDYRRIRRLKPLAARALPGLSAEEKSIWMGARPSTPSNVPVIGRSPRHDAVYFAFGHSHLGMTLGPVTGRLIADLVAGRDTGLDMTPYRPVRPLL